MLKYAYFNICIVPYTKTEHTINMKLQVGNEENLISTSKAH